MIFSGPLPPPTPKSGLDLSAGAVIGIIVGAVALVAIVVGIIAYIASQRRGNTGSPPSNAPAGGGSGVRAQKTDVFSNKNEHLYCANCGTRIPAAAWVGREEPSSCLFHSQPQACRTTAFQFYARPNW